MIHLILIRHGNTFEKGASCFQVGAKTDLPLTEEGRVQAEVLSSYFRTRKASPEIIYAGTLKRQIETATILSQSLKPNQIQFGEKALTEIDYGLWEGLSTDAIQERWKKEHEAWTLHGKWPEGIFGGSLDLHLKNIEEWLSFLRKTFKEGSQVMAIGSQGIFRLFHSERHLEKDLKVKTGHFCELEIHPERVVIRSWNQKPILP